MKTVLVLLFLTVASSQGLDTQSTCKYPELKEIMTTCSGSCSKDDQVIANWKNLTIGTTAADQCLVKCCWTAVGVIKADGSINKDNMVSLYKRLGVEVSAADQEEASSYNGDMTILVKKFNNLLTDEIKTNMIPCLVKT